MTKLFIANSDVLTKLNVRPSLAALGTQLTVVQSLTECPVYGDKRTIPAGTYKVVSRKHFRGGALVIEAA